jgi:CheY-like chemotaxis protein
MASKLLRNRLLVVDDEPALGRLIKNAAESAGFEVFVTKNPAAFFERARVWSPTMLMLDLGMPGTDGIQLLRRLAADKCSAHVILMSGADSKVVESATLLGRAHGLKMGGVLQKPVQLATLRKFLARFQVAKALLSADLAGAIATDQLFLEYQLKLDCRAARMTGVEALVRWRHPTLGIIHPDQFVPLAEETDLIHKIDRLGRCVGGEAVGRLACAQLRARNRGQRFSERCAGSQPAGSIAQTLSERGDHL